MARALLLHALLLSGVLGAAVPSTHEVHEKRGNLHKRWQKRSRVEQHAVLPMRIGLSQNLEMTENAEDYLMDVSDPASPNFAKYWTADEVTKAFQPSDSTVAQVHEWLTNAGIHPDRITHSDNKGWFAFHATNAEAEALLHTEFYEYHDSVTGGKIPGCDEYHLPKHIREHVDYVTPGIKLVAMESGTDLKKRKRSVGVKEPSTGKPVLKYKPTSDVSSPDIAPASSAGLPPNLRNCDKEITPDCIAALYKIPPTDKKAKPVKGNEIGVFESEGEYYAKQNLDHFFANYTKYIPKGTYPKLVSIDGGPGITTNASAGGGEVELDLELVYPIVYPQKVTLYSVDDAIYQQDPNITYTYGFNTLLDSLDGSYCTFKAYGEKGDSKIDPQYPDPRPGGYKGKLQCGTYEPTNVISISYGGQEADVPWSYQKRQCLEYLKLGMQGVSVFFASGDAGVGNYPAPYGFDNPDTGCLGDKGLQFNPTWPNNCPYVSNVGATKVYPGKTVRDPESAVFDPAGHPYNVNFSSGGGFSNIYTIPKYQKAAVDAYFKNHNPPYKSYSGIANDTMDIPALAKNGGIYNRIGRGIPDFSANGDNIAVFSANSYDLSGGTSASAPIFAAVINRINEERLRKGKKPVGFVNPTLYQHPEVFNDITNGTNPGCWTLGFSAVEGWDPVTGLGTPNYEKMLSLYLSLP